MSITPWQSPQIKKYSWLFWMWGESVNLANQLEKLLTHWIEPSFYLIMQPTTQSNWVFACNFLFKVYMPRNARGKHVLESRVRGSASVLLKNRSFPCAIAPTYWAHPGRTVAGSRLPFLLPGSWCLPSRNGRNVTPFQSLQWCVQGDKRT